MLCKVIGVSLGNQVVSDRRSGVMRGCYVCPRRSRVTRVCCVCPSEVKYYTRSLVRKSRV